MARCSAPGNFCCMRRLLDSRCWRWERPVSQSSTSIFRVGAGVRLWSRSQLAHTLAGVERSLDTARMSACATVILLLVGITSAHAAGPVDFGKAEFDAALAERKLKIRVDTELSLDPPETYRITLYKT